MKILVIEDDLFKYSKISDVIKIYDERISVLKYDNIHDTIIYLNQNSPNKIVLDMSLPSHTPKVGEGSPVSLPSGGIEILLELNKLDKLHIPLIILTQYNYIEIDNEYYSLEDSMDVIKKMFPINHLFIAFYDNYSDEWKDELNCFLRNQ